MVKCTIQQRSLLSFWSALIVHVSLNNIGENIKPKSGRYQKGRKDPLGRVGRTQDSPWGLMLCYLLTVAWLESWKFPACSYCEQDAPLRPDIASLEVFCPLRFSEVGQMLQEYTDQSLRKAPTQPLEISRDSSLQLFLQDHLRFWGKVTFHLNILSQGQNQQWQLEGYFSSYMVSSQWLKKMAVGGPSHFHLLAHLGSEPSMG